MKIYEGHRAPNARRVRIFLAEKGINDIDFVEVDIEKGENITADFKQKNPLAKIPVLELDDGSFISESVAICRYFEALHPEKPLMGEGPQQQAEIEMWQRRCEIYFMNLVGMGFQHTTGYFKDRMTPYPDWGVECVKQAQHFMVLLNQHLEGRDFICGDAFSIADITALCTVDFARVIKLRMAEDHSHLKAWYERVSDRPSARA